MKEARSIAFVIPHPYVDALACFREPISQLANRGWRVDLYTTVSPHHRPPVFDADTVRLIPIQMTRRGAVTLVTQLAAKRPRYNWLFTVPPWGLHVARKAASITRIPVVCISDELTSDAEAASDEQKRWRRREVSAHQRCAFTIALSGERAAFVRQENRLGSEHPIFIVPNAAPGPSRRLPSHYYQDTLGIDATQRVLLHAGSWWWKRLFPELETAPARWNGNFVLVFQGRMANHLGEVPACHNVRASSAILPAHLLDYAVSSAHIGLALYDVKTANNRLMGTASGKIGLYLKNGLPVIVTAHPSFDWVEREGCGVSVADLDGVDDAVERIWCSYDRYAANVRRFYDERLDFGRTFAPVLAALEAWGSR